jgi:hypothetical protein
MAFASRERRSKPDKEQQDAERDRLEPALEAGLEANLHPTRLSNPDRPQAECCPGEPDRRIDENDCENEGEDRQRLTDRERQ